MSTRVTCILCNKLPYTDRHGKTWDLCFDHCQQMWGGERPPTGGRRGKPNRRVDAAAQIQGMTFDTLPQVEPPAPPDHSALTHPTRLVLFDLNSETAVLCECTPISGRFDLAPDTLTLKEQILSAFQAGYVLAWRMIPNTKSDEETTRV